MMSININKLKAEAIKGIEIRLTFDGAFQRAKIYEESSTDKQRWEFRKSIAAILPITLATILRKERYSHNDHYKMLQQFADDISKKHATILKKQKIRIGNAQKFLNLYWKICWLLEKNIPMPLHCPFDRIVIQKLDKSVRDKAWTIFDSIEEYKMLVRAAEAKAAEKKMSIAEWELDLYLNNVNYE